MSQSPFTWLGSRFFAYPPRTEWHDVPGVYIFAGINTNSEWYPIYVGQTDSLAERLRNHEKWWEAQRLGATHIHAKTVWSRAQRLSLERQLILAYEPQLNQLI